MATERGSRSTLRNLPTGMTRSARAHRCVRSPRMPRHDRPALRAVRGSLRHPPERLPGGAGRRPPPPPFPIPTLRLARAWRAAAFFLLPGAETAPAAFSSATMNDGRVTVDFTANRGGNGRTDE